MGADRRDREAAHFADSGASDELPAITGWFNTDLVEPFIREQGCRPFLELAVATINEIRIERSRSPITVVSLGAGHGQIELSILETLAKDDLGDVTFRAIDLFAPTDDSEFLAGARSYRLERRSADVNDTSAIGPADVFMAHHALHHFTNLEGIFDHVLDAISNDGGGS